MNLPDTTPVLESLQTIPGGTWITAGGAGTALILAIIAFARGVIRQLVGMASIALAFMVAFYVFRHRTEIFGATGTTMPTDRLLMLSAGAGLLTYFLCKGIIHILAGFGLLNILGGLAGWKGFMLSVIPSGFLLWASTMALRLTGNIASLENTAAEVTRTSANTSTTGTSTNTNNGTGAGTDVGSGTGAGISTIATWLHQLSQQVDRSTLGSLVAKLDPYDMRATANLARLLILWPDGTVWNQLAEQSPRAARTLHHPKLTALGTDPKVRQAIERQDFAGLMQLPQVESAAADPELNPFLTGLALEQAMDTIIYKRPK